MTARPTTQGTANAPGPADIGKFYADHLMPLLSPGRRPGDYEIGRDIGILKTALRKQPLEEVLMVVREIRTQAEYGKLLTWIKPGESFTLRALLARTTGVYTYARFRHEAMKREAKQPDVGQRVADVFAAIAARGQP